MHIYLYIKLNNGTDCRVNVSPRVVGFQERLVTVAGPHDSLVKCTLSVVRQIQNDDHLREHLQIVYNRGCLQTADHLHVVAGVSISQDVRETRSLSVHICMCVYGRGYFVFVLRFY